VTVAFKLIESAQRRWQMVNAPDLVALVRAGATLVNGKLVERPGDQSPSPGEPASPTSEEDVADQRGRRRRSCLKILIHRSGQLLGWPARAAGAEWVSQHP
jgi:hypothetical protein